MFSVTSKENKWEYESDWLLHRCGKSEILSVRVSFVLLFHALPPFPCSHIPHPCQALSLSSPTERCPHCLPLTPMDLCLQHSLVWELLVLGAGAAWAAPIWVLLIAGTENIIAECTHRLLINTHTLLLQERMSSLVPSFLLLNVAYLWGKAQVGTVKAPVWRLFTLSTTKLLSYQKQGWLNIFLF